jgi:DNA replication and repair protein RecF
LPGTEVGYKIQFLFVYLKKLRVINFRNYSDTRLDLTGRVQCFVGKNGSGKTNLLDAVHYLSFTKSALNPSDHQNIRIGADHFFIQGEFQKEEQTHEVTCAYRLGSKKVVTEDREEYLKFSKHIGKYPLVLVAPNDIELVWDGSELRRKFIDNLLSQINPEYLENLIRYGQYLKQRNALLKLFSERVSIDQDMLDAYDRHLIPAGNFLYEQRRAMLAEFHPVFEGHYKFLVDGAPENVQIIYRSELESDDFKGMLRKNLQRDIVLQRTSVGVHRDDFSFLLNEQELKRFGSQGQQKSFLIALKLTEFQMLARHKKMNPLLLLDDIFDKLDDLRIHKLISLVANGTFGQLFITDARSGRSQEILREAGVESQVFEVENGNLNEIQRNG